MKVLVRNWSKRKHQFKEEIENFKNTNTEVWKPDNSYLLKLMNQDISNVGKITGQNILKKY